MKIHNKMIKIFMFVLTVCILPAVGYSITVTGIVKDGSDDSAISGVNVSIFSQEGGTHLYIGVTDAVGIYTAEIDDTIYSTVYLTFDHNNYVNTFGPVLVQGQLDTVYLAPDGIGGTGIINGRTTDAATTDGFIAEVSLSLYAGINTTSGTASYTTTSYDIDPGATVNTFEFIDVTPGTYTLLAEKDEFDDAKFNVVATGGGTKTYYVGMSSGLGAGNIRIVLTWGDSPSDLDSYLYTPEISGSTHQVWYGGRGSETSAPYATLDVDSMNSYGPETTTIYELHEGSYKYAVEWYADSSGNNTSLGRSNAKVDVYDENGLFATYNVPMTAGSNPAVRGDEWVVFCMDGDSGEIFSGGSCNGPDSAPFVPALREPVSGGIVATLLPTVSINNSNAPNFNALSYEFEIYSDHTLTNKVAEAEKAQGYLITSWTVPSELSDNTAYYWRARASDGMLASIWMPTAVFMINTSGTQTTIDIEVSQYVSALSQDSQTIEVTSNGSPIKGVSLNIPSGSLPVSCTVTVGSVNNPPPFLFGTNVIGSIIEFGPSGMRFNTPVTIKLPYAQVDLENAGVNDPNQIKAFTYNTVTLTWEEVDIKSVDIENKLLVFTVDHFSMYALGMTTDEQPAGSNGGSSGGTCFINTMTAR